MRKLLEMLFTNEPEYVNPRSGLKHSPEAIEKYQRIGIEHENMFYDNE